MIFAKINPVISIAKQQSLFNPTMDYTTGSYMTAVANEYSLGAEKVDFRVTYGNCEFENGAVVGFTPVHNDRVTLSGAAIQNWGTDDSSILTAIAADKGISVVQVVSGSITGGRRFA